MTERKGAYNETTNTFAGITTPSDQQDIAATDSFAEVVEEVMDNLQETIAPNPHKEHADKTEATAD